MTQDGFYQLVGLTKGRVEDMYGKGKKADPIAAEILAEGTEIIASEYVTRTGTRPTNRRSLQGQSEATVLRRLLPCLIRTRTGAERPANRGEPRSRGDISPGGGVMRRPGPHRGIHWQSLALRNARTLAVSVVPRYTPRRNIACAAGPSGSPSGPTRSPAPTVRSAASAAPSTRTFSRILRRRAAPRLDWSSPMTLRPADLLLDEPRAARRTPRACEAGGPTTRRSSSPSFTGSSTTSTADPSTWTSRHGSRPTWSSGGAVPVVLRGHDPARVRQPAVIWTDRAQPWTGGERLFDQLRSRRCPRLHSSI
jgi:hypothetical protein